MAAHSPNALRTEPQMPPHDVKVKRLNGTAMNVSWTRLSIVEAQSIAVSYVVSYSPQSARKRQVRDIVPAIKSYVVISGLDPGTIYHVQVFAMNDNGQSIPVTAEITGEFCKYLLCLEIYLIYIVPLQCSATKSML